MRTVHSSTAALALGAILWFSAFGAILLFSPSVTSAQSSIQCDVNSDCGDDPTGCTIYTCDTGFCVELRLDGNTCEADDDECTIDRCREGQCELYDLKCPAPAVHPCECDHTGEDWRDGPDGILDPNVYYGRYHAAAYVTVFNSPQQVCVKVVLAGGYGVTELRDVHIYLSASPDAPEGFGKATFDVINMTTTKCYDLKDLGADLTCDSTLYFGFQAGGGVTVDGVDLDQTAALFVPGCSDQKGQRWQNCLQEAPLCCCFNPVRPPALSQEGAEWIASNEGWAQPIASADARVAGASSCETRPRDRASSLLDLLTR
jgi:hypothetical protein